jgi:Cu/Ag efflux protein CusF
MKKALAIMVSCSCVVFLVAAVAFADQVFTFTVKGVVKGLPGNGLAKNEILVKHEAIPTYRDEAGNMVGMHPMTMGFYLSDKVTTEGIQVGDSIEMVVEQTIKPKFNEQVVSLKKLP